MAGFYKEFMAALHAGLGRGDVNQGLRIFRKKERIYSMFCLVTFNINKWQEILGWRASTRSLWLPCPLVWGEEMLTRDSDFLEKRKKIQYFLPGHI